MAVMTSSAFLLNLALFFFFQAEDGIRDDLVTGVQTCALPIYTCQRKMGKGWSSWCRFDAFLQKTGQQWYGWAKVWKEDTIETYVSACWMQEIGRASCRERV